LTARVEIIEIITARIGTSCFHNHLFPGNVTALHVPCQPLVMEKVYGDIFQIIDFLYSFVEVKFSFPALTIVYFSIDGYMGIAWVFKFPPTATC
jgi:hypothetical protein